MLKLWKVIANNGGVDTAKAYYVAGRNFAEAKMPIQHLRDHITHIEPMGDVLTIEDCPPAKDQQP